MGKGDQFGPSAEISAVLDTDHKDNPIDETACCRVAQSCSLAPTHKAEAQRPRKAEPQIKQNAPILHPISQS
jgi:hypothetical protein